MKFSFKNIGITYVLLIITFVSVMPFTSCRKEKSYKIGVSQCSRDDWRTKMNDEIEREILMHPEATVEIRSADDSNEKQIADLRYFVDNDFDIIIVAPNEADAITPEITKIYESGKPVIVFDRDVNGDKYTAFQGADNEEIGRLCARYAADKLHDKASIIELYGLKGSTPAIARNHGFNEVIEGKQNMNVVAKAYGNWNYEDAYRLSDSLFSIYPEVTLVFAHNDRMAVAAAAAAREHGISPYIIGVDAAPEIGMKAVRDSIIDATFLYPTEGHRLIRTALSILRGEPYDTIASLPTPSAVDLSNADILLVQNESLKEETSKMRSLKGEIDQYWEKHSAQTLLLYIFIIVALLSSILVFIILKAYRQRKRYQEVLVKQNEQLARQHQQQKALNEQLNDATQSKLVFFTNVSHDLRTPLALIAEPVTQLVEADNLTPTQKTLVHLADKNVRILRRLINQILDFRKFENGKLELNYSEADFGVLALEWTDAFRSVAKKRGVKLNVQIEQNQDFKFAFDVEKIERVCYNLLSNAIKYTPANGEVFFACSCDGKNLNFSVSDTGIGISDSDRIHIFDRFFQVDKVRPKGSGIGLSLVKAFVELHGGEIRLESEINKGSRFTVTLPVKHVSERDGTDMKRYVSTGTIVEKDVERELESIEEDISEFADNRPLLLIIDDNDDILVLLRTLLGSEYNIITASDGHRGLALAARYTPDVILCDVMMPVMDGMECCRQLKSELSTSHIPVLLLTACSADEQRAAGYECGADGYLPKPVDSSVLRKRLENLIANRRLIRRLWESNATHREEGDLTKPVTKGTEQPKSTQDLENEFYSRFVSLVEKEMENPDLSVDHLASEMGLGRSQFYRKIKALTNYSPVELLRNMRLKRARHLLTITDRSISEIGYEVGFSTPAYFTKCYRDAYGETPSELRARLKPDVTK